MEAMTAELATTAATTTTTILIGTASGDDGAFGPQLGSRFDFTLLFDHAIIAIAPTIALIAACPLYVYFRHRDPVQVNRDALFWMKLSGALVLFLIQLVQLVLWTTAVKVSYEQDWAIGASAVSCFAALCLALMLSVAHRHSIHPSTLLSVYFFLTVFLDGIRARSYLLREGLDAIGAIQIVVAIAKFSLLILEEIPKTTALIDVDLLKFFGREAFSGFWARSLLFWLNETFVIGFRNILTMDDLGNLGPEFSTQRLVEAFNNIWERADRTNEHALHRTLLKQHYGSLLLAVPARIGLSVCSFAQPFIIYHAVDIVDRIDATNTEKNGLILATVLVYTGIPLFRAIYTYYTNRCVILVRGTLLGKIYGKTLVLPAHQAAEGAALTHVTADVDGIEYGILEFHDLWISYFEIGFSTYFLYSYVQYSCFLLFISTAASTAWSWYFGPKMGEARKIWTQKIEKRVKETASLLAQARSVKTQGLTDIVRLYIHRLRDKELKFSGRFRWSQSIVHCMAMMLESGTPVIVVAGAIYLSKIPLPLEARRMFTILAFVTLSVIPMEMILRSYSGVRNATSCVDRIAVYLAETERRDDRTTREVTPDLVQEKGVSVEEPRDYTIEVSQAFIAPNGQEETAVRNATVSVPHGKLTIAVGPVGSGKTIFLKSLLGEANIVDGSILINKGPIAYCQQTPWLCNETIRENITGQGEVDETWYRSVLNYCYLLDDLEDLPDGDKMLAGSYGSKLSGGQKLRVALARALHSRAQVMIFDDIFSGLDQTTARKIFYGLFSTDGLLRRLRTTVILATHSLEFIDAADLVLRFDRDGQVAVEAGQGDRELVEFSQAHESASSQSEATDNLATKEVDYNPEEAEDENAAANLRQRGDWSLWLFFFKSAPTWMFVAFVVASLVNAVAEKMTSIFMRIWIDTNPNSRSPFAAYAVLGFTSTLTYLAMAILLYQNILPRYASYLHTMLVDTILEANIVFLTSADHGLLVNRITQDMTVITQGFAGTLLQFPYSIGTALTDLGLVMSASYYALVLIPFLCILFYIIQLVFLRTSRQLRILDLEATAPLHKQLTEIGSGIEHIRAFQWEKTYLRQSYELINASQKPRYYMSCIQRWLTLVLELTNLVLAVIMVIFAIFWDHATTKSSIGLGFIGLLSLGEALQFFVTTWTTMETSMGAIARLRTFWEETPQEVDDPNPVHVPPKWPQQGVIEFKDVTATYNPKDGRESILRNMSFRIPAHKMAGFLGRTASGKSTIFLVLLGFLPYKGSVTIDGLEVSRIPRKLLRSRVTAMPQDSLILPGTIRQNLMPWLLNEQDPKKANQCSMLAVSQVLEDLLLTDKIIAAGNLNAPMEELGMSAGERQIFSVARSMFLNLWHEARIVLMDEVSSHIDYETDKQIQWAIGEAFHGLTMCIIAHRMQSVEKAHMIFEVDNGVLSVHREDEEPINPEYMANYSHRW